MNEADSGPALETSLTGAEESAQMHDGMQEHSQVRMDNVKRKLKGPSVRK